MTITATQQKRGQLVDSPHVDQLISKYKKDRWILNSERLGKKDSLSIWYGLKELEEFLRLATLHQADGIKMYFGVYPSDFAEVPEFQDRQTIVLVATKEKILNNRSVHKDIYIHEGGRSEILAFNLGSACPPFCGTGLPPDGDGPYGIDMEKIGLSIIDSENGITII